ncbi:hypothetical protein WME75_44650 [Sorangium sp. So ce1014]|uniref:hypothetical protein n=1 Tax=Sorangium sp. So ce1014 TaxID=3133326 RepID=UPI003F631B63
MRHPFELISADRRTPILWSLLGLAVASGAALAVADKRLRTKAAPWGIISFELAGTRARVRNILESWDEDARNSAALSLGVAIDEGLTWHLAEGLTARSPTWVLGDAGPNVLVGTSPEGVSISHDAGASWKPSAAGLPADAAVVALAADKNYVLAGVVTQDGR